ncbi:MAG: 3-isopropylmalate dehydratase large subunit [Eubacteriales bacterium]
MSATMTQRLIAAHTDGRLPRVGETVLAAVDVVLANDITAPVAIRELEAHGFTQVCDPDKIVLVMDHFVPCKDIASAQQCRLVRDFARAQGIRHFYDAGCMGIEHALLPEKGHARSGQLIVGADSHTCTYGALGAFATGMGSTDIAFAMATGKTWLRVPPAILFVLKNRPGEWVSGKDIILSIIGQIGVSGAQYRSMEFCGEGLAHLSMDDRFTMANMAIEAGAKNGVFETDGLTAAYEAERGHDTVPCRVEGTDAYERVIEVDLSAIRPTVSAPHSPDNTREVHTLPEIPVQQAVIGSCTNGRLSDLAAAARVLRGRTVHPDCRTIIIPATQQIYMDALKAGYIETFIAAGCVVSTPTCGPCLGGHMGILAAGERAVSTTNRNFVGRMGHSTSEVWLAGPAVAAASAVAGKIVSPEQIGGI